jgi:hypothetical protein
MSGIDFALDRHRLIIVAAGVGLIAAAVGALAAALDPKTFFAGYLVAAVWTWSLAMGGLCLAVMFHLTGGRWGEAGRRWFDVAARSMPWVALIFLPLAFGLHHLYPWTRADFFAGMQRVEHRQWYFTTDFFLARSAVYFGVWILLSSLVAGIPGRQRSRRIPGGQATAGLAAIALLLTITWAAMDWLMSLDPMFYSTLFGGLVGGGALLGGMAFVMAGATLASRTGKISGPGSVGSSFDPKAINDLANLLLAMVMLWAYFSFSQFLLMWSGNLPEEASWYLARGSGGWQAVPILLAAGGFALPLALLISSSVKRSPNALGCLALWLILIRLVELDWFVLPHFSPRDFSVNWCAILMPVATGGIWLSLVAWDAGCWGVQDSSRRGSFDDG